MSTIRLLPRALCALALLSLALPAVAAGIPVKDGEKIAFLGDSITAAGAKPGGYASLVIAGLKANGITATMIPAGISGHKSNQMLARLEKDVLEKKPDWMTLSCGVNDVWHGARGVPLEDYKKNITQLVDQCQTAKVKVMILTATMIKEDPASPENQKLAAYNEFLRELAREKNCLLADLNADMQAAVAKKEKDQKGNLVTTDGVHMNPAGNRMMAIGVLKGFGLLDAQIQKAEKEWEKEPAKAQKKKP